MFFLELIQNTHSVLVSNLQDVFELVELQSSVLEVLLQYTHGAERRL